MTIFYIYFLSKCEEGTKVYMSTVFRRTHGGKVGGHI